MLGRIAGNFLSNFSIRLGLVRTLSTTCTALKADCHNRSSFSYRTHTCGEICEENIGQNVTLCGWIQSKRFDTFLLLRDYNGTVQILVPPGGIQSTDGTALSSLSSESVLKVTGNIVARPNGQENVNMKTGKIEIVPETIEVLSHCKKLPFQTNWASKKREAIRQRYRYLDIRSDKMQETLRTRSKLISNMRKVLEENSFIEVETPYLFRPTPGGAKEFIVPNSIFPGTFFSLPQSPQQLKQLLMVGGIDRYYQVARCFRDETLTSDRQLEFTQLDLEMSFASQQDVMGLTEQLIKSSWPQKLPDKPFPVLTYKECMDKYGTDKPDLRYDIKMQDITSIVSREVIDLLKCDVIKAIRFEDSLKTFTGNFKTTISKSLAADYKGHSNFSYLKYWDGEWKVSPSKHGFFKVLCNLTDIAKALDLKQTDVAILSWGKTEVVRNTLSGFQTIFFSLLKNYQRTYPCKEGFHFLWVVDFPMFEKNAETGTLQSSHHPFTAPHPEDVDKLDDDPLSVRSLAYDLVLNGHEIGGGSIRIHDAALQRRVFEDILGLDSSQMFYFFEALESGAPPHGGIALGVDRLMSILCQTESIRDVIAFPKSTSGHDMMTNAPCTISEDLKSHFHIETT